MHIHKYTERKNTNIRTTKHANEMSPKNKCTNKKCTETKNKHTHNKTYQQNKIKQRQMPNKNAQKQKHTNIHPTKHTNKKNKTK